MKHNFVKYCRDILWFSNPFIIFEIIIFLPSAHIQKLVSNEFELLSDFTLSFEGMRLSFARIEMTKNGIFEKTYHLQQQQS